jgi:tRNA (mo5U34)-methyltransferase
MRPSRRLAEAPEAGAPARVIRAQPPPIETAQAGLEHASLENRRAIMAPVRFRRGRGGPERVEDEYGARRRRELLEQLERLPHWFHSIDLGYGVVTPGAKTTEHLASELEALRLPDLRGRTVLDIGAWDGFYSFEAERRGAARVVALDHFVWSWNRDIWEAERAGMPRNAAGRPPDQSEVPESWDPIGLPGKRPFDLVHGTLGSRVEPVVADFMSEDLRWLGSFDVVLFLGVLYHMRDPLGSLRRLAELTRGTAIIETEARLFPAVRETPVCEYFGGTRLVDDPTNWWAPNEAALRLMLLEAGFDRVDVLVAAPDPPATAAPESVRYRTIAHAHKAAADPEASAEAARARAEQDDVHAAALAAAVRDLTEQRDHLARQLEVVYSSKSWALTAPMRKVAARARAYARDRAG